MARRALHAELSPSRIKIGGGGDDNVDVLVYSDLIAHVSDLDLSSVHIGTVGVNVKSDGNFDANLEAADLRIRLRFSRQALIAAGVLTGSTTNVGVVANLTNGIQIIAHVPVTIATH